MKGPRPEDPDFGRLLGPQGPLAQEPFYEHRPGQVTMAESVWWALRHDGLLLAEAGTGTGKSLAYLLPALYLDRRVVVATGTKALQEQLARKDVPLCEKLLGRPVRAVTVKGRANYLCLHYWRQFKAQPLFSIRDEAKHLRSLARWAEETGTGDKAEWRGIPEGLSFWRDINARAERCLGTHCPLYNECFVVLLRQQAEAAEIVITNHHLLFADLALKRRWDAAALPTYAHLILDEAHDAEDTATQFFGTAASKRMLQEWLQDAARAFPAPGHGGLAEKLQNASQAAIFFFAHWEGPEGRGTLDPVTLDADARKLVERMGLRLDAAALALEGEKGDEESLGLLERLEAWREALSFALSEERDGYVRWVEARGKNVTFGSSPIDVGPILGEHLFSELNGGVLTSATLAVGGAFDYIRERLGLPANAQELRVPSPFDYASQGLFYIPERFPDPSTEDFPEALCNAAAELVGFSRGRAFVLCTSIKNMNLVGRALETRIPYPVLLQGDEPKGLLLERFREMGNAVLVATASFWQGVDVQGEALSLVVLDKIPFAVPSDPLTQARIESIRAAGGDPFRSYQIPSAAILLQQGAGRLIRSASDRGVVACLDVRLRRRSYGKSLLASLPPFRLTSDVGEVEAFFMTSPDE